MVNPKNKSPLKAEIDELYENHENTDIENTAATLTDKDYAMLIADTYYSKMYLESNFKKEVSEYDILFFSVSIANQIITAESDADKKSLIDDLTEIINDKSKLNEFFFKHLAMIKAWNESYFEIKDKINDYDDELEFEKAFCELMEKNNSKWQYKAWNDELKVKKKEFKTKASEKGDD